MTFYFIFVNTESISATGSQMTEVEAKEAALKSSFVAVYRRNSFSCIGYIYSVDPQRVFAYRFCIPLSKLLSDKKKTLKGIRVKSTSDESGVKDVLSTQNFLAIFVSIYT